MVERSHIYVYFSLLCLYCRYRNQNMLYMDRHLDLYIYMKKSYDNLVSEVLNYFNYNTNKEYLKFLIFSLPWRFTIVFNDDSIVYHQILTFFLIFWVIARNVVYKFGPNTASVNNLLHIRETIIDRTNFSVYHRI